MAKKKNYRQEVIIDMIDFLITYGASIIDRNQNVSQIIFDAAKNDLTNLDDLFKDNGYGRTVKFYEIGKGCLHNSQNYDEETLVAESDKLAKEAVNYLGSHITEFEKWRFN